MPLKLKKKKSFKNRDFTYILQQFSSHYVVLMQQFSPDWESWEFIFITLNLLTFITNDLHSDMYISDFA